jgi:hypothetical protein
MKTYLRFMSAEGSPTVLRDALYIEDLHQLPPIPRVGDLVLAPSGASGTVKGVLFDYANAPDACYVSVFLEDIDHQESQAFSPSSGDQATQP